MTDSKQDLAEDRTDWAEDRTVLANERTFAGWVRTGMGAIAIAIGLQAVFRETEEVWIAKSVASGFLLLAAFVFWTARRTATGSLDRLSRHDIAAASRRFITRAAVALIGLAATVGFVLWRL